MTRSIALVAHDQRKDAMVDWARAHRALLLPHRLFATGTTGGRLTSEAELPVTALKSGPLGGDAQIGAMIAEGKLDAAIAQWREIKARGGEGSWAEVSLRTAIKTGTTYNY